MKRSLTIAILAVFTALPLSAQNNWGLRAGVGAERKIAKGLDAGLEFNYHQTDNFKFTDRWSAGLSLSKRLYRNEAKTFNVKAGLGYKYLQVYNNWTTKYKGDETLNVPDGLDPEYYKENLYSFNLIDSYIEKRHRITTSLQASAELGRFKISLREAYQFTHTDSVEYNKDKYRYKDGWKPVESELDGKSASNKNVLRSKIGVDYDIPHWKYDPFVSYELFNSLDKSFETQKSRITAGVDFSFNKKHNFEVAYMWQNQHDDDEPAGSYICVNYEFTF